MASNPIIPNRKEIRLLLAAHLRGAATGYQQIYPYENDDLEGQSPVLRIMSGSSNRPRVSFKGTFATFNYTLQSLVLYKDTQSGSDWTPDKAEDLLDDLEVQVAVALFHDVEWPKGGRIKDVYQVSGTRVRKDVIQGKTYLVEYIPIAVEVFHG